MKLRLRHALPATSAVVVVAVISAALSLREADAFAFVTTGTRPTSSCGRSMARAATSSSSSSWSKLCATATDAIASLETSQKSTVDSIAAAIPDLAPKSELSWTPSDSVSIGGNTATLDARDAPGPANVAWLSSLSVANRLSSLTIFNGPLTDVPHLLSRCAVMPDGATLAFDLDFRPRAYGAYEMRDAQGNYPGPDQLGRKAFEYSGARSDYDTKFGTPEVQQFVQSTLASFGGVGPGAFPPTELDMLTRGPLAISVTMPLNDANVAAVAEARAKAAEYWLSWATDDSHGHRPGAPINSQYVYDTKYKQNAYGALLPVYTGLFGPEDGARLAAADMGPLDEAYVGGAS